MNHDNKRGRFGPPGDLDLVLVDKAHGLRRDVEEFACRVYRRAYGADLKTFSNELLTIVSVTKGIISCVGINTPESGELFLEQYLDSPAEEEISRMTGMPVDRKDVVEIGTLAVRSRGLCRLAMSALTGLLLGRKKRFFAFTAVRTLRNTLERLEVPFTRIVEADPGRVANSAEWGSYYEASPEVIFVDVEECMWQVEKVLQNTGCGLPGEMVDLMCRMLLRGLLLEDTCRAAAGF